jgi:hypothetical protein
MIRAMPVARRQSAAPPTALTSVTTGPTVQRASATSDATIAMKPAKSGTPATAIEPMTGTAIETMTGTAIEPIVTTGAAATIGIVTAKAIVETGGIWGCRFRT